MIVATFIGTDGIAGFKYGKTYRLTEPAPCASDWNIMVQNTDGAEWCSYNTVEAFLNHWYVLRCI